MTQPLQANLPDEHPTGNVAVVGDSGREISVQTLQDVYNAITGRSETLTQGYEMAYRVEMADLKNLHERMKQLVEPYLTGALTESVRIYYDEDRSELFSSFERFSMHDCASLSPVESVLIKYNLAIIVPKTRRLQNYTISIRIGSRVTIIREMQKHLRSGRIGIHPTFFPGPALFRHAMVTIEYVDYLIARNFRDHIHNWFHGLPTQKPSWLMTQLRRRSHWLPRALKYGSAAAACAIVGSLIPSYLPMGTADLQTFAYLLLASGAGIFASYRIGLYAGELAENAIDSTYDISYVKLTRGDEKAIEEAIRDQRWHLAKAGLSFGTAIAYSVIVKLIVSAILP